MNERVHRFGEGKKRNHLYYINLTGVQEFLEGLNPREEEYDYMVHPLPQCDLIISYNRTKKCLIISYIEPTSRPDFFINESSKPTIIKGNTISPLETGIHIEDA